MLNLRSFGKLVSFGAAALCIFGTHDVQAQQQENCTPVYEEIIPLKNPSFTNLYLWRRVVGRTGYDWFSRYLELDDGNALTIGISTQNIEDETVPRFLSLTRYDQEGQILRERQVALPRVQNIAGALRLGGVIIVGVNIIQADGRVLPQLLRMNAEGENLKVRDFKEDGIHLEMVDVILNQDQNLVVSFNSENQRYTNDMASIQYTLDKNLKKIRRRLYMPGTPNRYNQMTLNPDGSLAVAGSVDVDSKIEDKQRLGGWLVNLDKKGAIYWQKSYARGQKAELVRAKSYGERGFVATGTAWPSLLGEEAKNSALWVMHVDVNGKPLWQRFITGRHQYGFSAVDMHVFDDGRIAVLANVKALLPSDKVRSHVRLLTFTPQGTLLQDQAFVEGSESMAHSMMMNKDGQFRIIGQVFTGYAESDVKTELETANVDDTEAVENPGKQGETKELSALDQLSAMSLEESLVADDNEDEGAQRTAFDVLTPVVRGWLLAVARPEPYKNPCR
jgi:hypothetical protein|tara:strand:+ start:41515 stop:43026 length:1512 start_codon:yes stop_codon:yes gene_type:complete